MNPSGFLLSLASLSDRFGAFREHLEDYDWPSNPSIISRVPHAVVRVAGFGLAVSTVVAFALVPNP